MQVRLDVWGIGDPLLDQRVPRLVVAVRSYRRCGGVALFAAGAGWRLSFVSGHTIAYRPNRSSEMLDSFAPLSKGTLETLTAAGVVLADLLPPPDQQGAVA